MVSKNESNPNRYKERDMANMILRGYLKRTRLKQSDKWFTYFIETPEGQYFRITFEENPVIPKGIDTDPLESDGIPVEFVTFKGQQGKFRWARNITFAQMST